MRLKTRQAVFISGKGSNLKGLLDAYSKIDFYVFANKDCQGLTWAKRRGCCTEVVALKTSEDWSLFSKKINDLKIKRIFLLGFMKVIPEYFLDTVKARIVNIHPSYLPDFPGLKAMENSFEAKKGMGCTLHEVSVEVDEGETILKKSVQVNNDLNFSGFKERLHGFEQQIVRKYVEKTRGLYE